MIRVFKVVNGIYLKYIKNPLSQFIDQVYLKYEANHLYKVMAQTTSRSESSALGASTQGATRSTSPWPTDLPHPPPHP